MSVPTAPATASTRGFGSVKEGRLVPGSRASLLLTLTTPPTWRAACQASAPPEQLPSTPCPGCSRHGPASPCRPAAGCLEEVSSELVLRSGLEES